VLKISPSPLVHPPYQHNFHGGFSSLCPGPQGLAVINIQAQNKPDKLGTANFDINELQRGVLVTPFVPWSAAADTRQAVCAARIPFGRISLHSNSWIKGSIFDEGLYALCAPFPLRLF